MQLEPDSQDVALKPGEEIDAVLVVTNDQATARTYETFLSSISFGNNADELSFQDLSHEKQSWFTVTPQTFDLPSGEKQTVHVHVHVPLTEQSHVETVAIIVREKHEGEGILVLPSTASILFVHVGDDLVSSLQVASLTGVPRLVTERKGQAHFTAVLRNDGTDTAAAIADVVVRNIFGKVIDRFPLTSAPKRVPSQTYRNIDFSWPPEQGFRPFLFGPYRFDIVQGDVIAGTVKIGFYPIRFMAVLGGIFLLVILGILIYVRRHR